MSGCIEDLFHVGIVVDDFEATCAEMAATSGIRWSPRIEANIPVWTADGGEQMFKCLATYSIEGPHLEIIQSIPGTIMQATKGKPLHHLGYWTNDLKGDSERLAAAGNPLVLCAIHEGNMAGYAYHEMPNGLYMEIVDRGAFPDWTGFLNGTFKFESKV